MATKPSFDDYVVARERHLLRVAYLLAQDAQLAEDLVQTALTKAWFAWHRVQGDPEPYVRKILVNTFVSAKRRRWNVEQPTGRLPERPLADHESSPDLRRALAALPRGQRAVIVLRYFEDLTEAETARVLDVSIGTVKSQTAKALVRLRVDPLLEVTE
jgi:RNA polymerase sigma-70 factor (sigma-E family)